MLNDNEKSVVIRIERDDGAEFTVGTGTNWKMPKDSIADWNDLDYSVTTTPRVLDDGDYITSTRVEKKDRTLVATYTGQDAAAARSRAGSFFIPHHTYKAHITYMGRTRWCEGTQLRFKPSTENIYEKPEITWTLLCPDPYMRGENGHTETFGDSVGYIGFPYVSHLASDMGRPQDYPAGVPASILIFDGKNTVHNTGDVNTPYAVRIRTRGNVVNPRIEKDGYHVQIDTVMTEGDELLIDFRAIPPEVILNGQDIMEKTTRDSNFEDMEMKPGNNVFTFTCENMESRTLADVQVLFHERYVSV